MSGKTDKAIRREVKKYKRGMFLDFIIEVSCKTFWSRLKFCLMLAFMLHPLQRANKARIKAERAIMKAAVK